MRETPSSDAAFRSSALLEGRNAIVTGAAGGLGRAIRARMEEAGANVLPVDVVGDDVVRLDIATGAGTSAAVAAALERFGALDTLVLNAGVQHVAPIERFPEAEWDRLMDVLLKGPFLLMKAAWSVLTARPGGRIIVTASTSSHVAEPNKAAYVAAKHGLLGLVKVAAVEGAPHGLTANAVAPGWMLTPLAEQQIRARVAAGGMDRETVVSSMLAGVPTERFVEPGEVANVVVFLASRATTGVSGVSLPVDLGALVI